MKKKLKNCLGFSLVEMVVVVSVFGLILAGAFTFFMFTTRTTMFIDSTSNAQQELRAMLRTIQRQARVATKAHIFDSFSDAVSNAGLYSYEEGALAFYVNNDTLYVGRYDGPSTSTWTWNYTSLEIQMFVPMEGLSIQFEPNINAEYETDLEKYAVKVTIGVNDGKHRPTSFEDTFYLSNLEADGNELVDTTGTGSGGCLVIQPAVKLEP